MKLTNTDLNLYKAFMAVYETQSTTKASENLYVGQTAVSHNIRELEKQLDTKLFERHSRGLTPTYEAGELYKFITTALIEINNGEDFLNSVKELKSGTLRIGCQTFLANNVLLEYFCNFHKEYPSIKLNIEIRPKDELLDMLAKHDLDCVVEMGSIDSENFDTKRLANLPYTFFASKEFVVTNNLPQRINKDKLRFLPVILHSTSRTMMKELFKKMDMEIKPTIEATTTDLMYGMVLKNMGIGYCIEAYLNNSYRNENIVCLNVNAELPIAELLFVSNKTDKNSITKVFFKGLQEFCQKVF